MTEKKKAMAVQGEGQLEEKNFREREYDLIS